MILYGLTWTLAAKIFTGLIIATFAISLIMMIFLWDKRAWIVSKAPGILILLGIIAAFWEIAQGVDIIESLKLAIWPCILGMFCAIAINAVNYIAGIFIDDSSDTNDSEIMILVAESIEESVNALQESMKKQSLLISDTVQALGKGIHSVDELSKAFPVILTNTEKILASGLKKIRDTMQNQSGDIESVMKNLETAIKQQVSQIAGAASNLDGILKKGLSNIEAISQKWSEVEDSVTKYTGDIAGTLESQAEEFKSATQNLSSNVLSSLEPVMTEKFASFTQDLSQKIFSLTETSLTEQEKKIDSITETLDKSLNQQQKLMSDIVLGLQSILTTGIQNIESDFNKTGAQIKNVLNASVQNLDTNTQTYLNRLAKNLAAINQQIVSDFQQLAGIINNLNAKVNKSGGSK